MEFARRHNEPWPQAAVAVDAQGLVVDTTIGMTPLARKTLLAIDVRLDRAVVAGHDMGHPCSTRQDLRAKFMTRNARVAVKSHLALIPRVIAPTDPDSMHSN